MKVTVVPSRPIPGILPKNKWIDTKMELDLNKNEIKHCMQYGNVYDKSGKLIDTMNIQNLFNKKVYKKLVLKIETPVVINENINLVSEKDDTNVSLNQTSEEVLEINEEEPVVIETEEKEAEVADKQVTENIEIYNNLKLISYKKENEYIVVETQMDSNSTLEGDLYGLFLVTSGPKPSYIEYFSDEKWIKFNNKFSNLDTVNNEDKFIFRFIPRNDNQLSIRITIKEASEILSKLEFTILPSDL